MIRILTTLTLFIAALFSLPSSISAGYLDGFTEDGYVYHAGDSYWWCGGIAYTREKVCYYETCYYRNGCYSYPYQQQYYYWKYTPVPITTYTPAYTAPTVPAYGPGWKAGITEVAKQVDDNNAYLKALEALQIRPIYQTSLGNYFNSGYTTYGNNLNLGAYGAQGNTTYGYTLNSVAQAYGQTDLNALYQQSGRLVQGAQEYVREAHSGHEAVVGAAGSAAARVAQAYAEAEATKIKLDAARPEAATTTQTTITGTGTTTGTYVDPTTNANVQVPTVVSPQQPVTVAPQQPVVVQQDFMQTVAIPNCGSCHSGQNVAGKFDISIWPKLSLEMKEEIVHNRLLNKDPSKLMPRKDRNGTGHRLPDETIKKFMAN
jgi:hypothetical protein